MRLVAAGDCPESTSGVAPPAGARDLLDESGIAPEHRGWLARVLPPTFFADEPRLAMQIADEHPTAVVVCSDGVIRRGRVLEPRTAGDRHPGALELRGLKLELEAQIGDTAKRADTATDRHREVSSRLESRIESLDEVAAELAVHVGDDLHGTDFRRTTNSSCWKGTSHHIINVMFRGQLAHYIRYDMHNMTVSFNDH